MKRHELVRLWASYFAALMHTCNDAYDEEFPEKEKAYVEEIAKQGKADAAFLNSRHIIKHKNDDAGFILRRLEPPFVLFLIKCFPGKATEVKKYIRLGGYPEEEIPVLLDVAVGRNDETEFLYKGRPKSDPPRQRKR